MLNRLERGLGIVEKTSKKLLTVNEAAERLALSPDTIRKWLRSGQIEGVKISRIWRVYENDIEEIIKEGRTK